MAKFFTVASSSSGNCYYLGSGGTGILIDCGLSCRIILSALEEKGVDPQSLAGILITHEHTDHIHGLESFLKKYRLPVYASEKVLDFLAGRGCVPPETDLRPADPGGFLAAGMMVSPFRTSHDSVGSLGFSIATADERKVTVCTDTGYLTEEALEHLVRLSDGDARRDFVYSRACDDGLNQLARRHAADVVTVDLPNPAVIRNVNTPTDLARLIGEEPD